MEISAACTKTLKSGVLFESECDWSFSLVLTVCKMVRGAFALHFADTDSPSGTYRCRTARRPDTVVMLVWGLLLWAFIHDQKQVDRSGLFAITEKL